VLPGVTVEASSPALIEKVRAAMNADTRQTDFCMYLSAILLAGLTLNAVFGWWWADPIGALIMVPIIAKEGIDGLRGDPCCD
jgi:divalent metal cation (Fe/Co/Zn/Cd) transporter